MADDRDERTMLRGHEVGEAVAAFSNALKATEMAWDTRNLLTRQYQRYLLIWLSRPPLATPAWNSVPSIEDDDG